nr:hypothetical protein [Agrobacterium sp.]
MWLYVPNISTSSESAPVDSALISASNWQFQALEQSAWSRGKPSRSRNWYQQWKRAIWLQRLFGAMPEPSMAAHGVERLTASLAASRASLIASPDERADRTTNATSGLTLAVSSSSQAHGSSSLKMSPACSRRGLTKSLAQSGFAETFTSLASRWREDCSRRQKLARRTRESASSSSQWPTATANMVTGPGSSGRDGGDNLQTAATAWPTPTANDWKGSGPTLERKDGQMRGDRLDYAAEQLWSTPRASDAEKGGPNQSFGAGGQPLPSQAAQWATPRVAVNRTSTIAMVRPDSVSSLSLEQQAEILAGITPIEVARSEKLLKRFGLSSPPDQKPGESGETSSPERRSLNPLFVEWLMGWPPEWTLLAWTDFGCSAMELSHWKRRMRSALLSLGLPAEAPPAQLALFG